VKGNLITIIFITFNFALAEDYKVKSGHRESLQEQLEGIIRFLGSDNYDFTLVENFVKCNEDFKKLTFRNCSWEQKSKITRIHMEAFRLGSFLEQEVAAYLDKPEIISQPKHLENIQKIADKVNCINSKIDKARFRCDDHAKRCNGSVNAYTQKKTDFSFLAALFYDMGSVILCDRMLREGEKMHHQAGVFIHELAHQCGVNDLHYLDHNNMSVQDYQNFNVPATTRVNDVLDKIVTGEIVVPPEVDSTNIENFINQHIKDSTVDNADNYSVWAIGGFCLPGYDCQNRSPATN
tara:strand:- start:7341 stop:8219 length:879 start_codon:yes stop_codon:yes gene_type:complete